MGRGLTVCVYRYEIQHSKVSLQFMGKSLTENCENAYEPYSCQASLWVFTQEKNVLFVFLFGEN